MKTLTIICAGLLLLMISPGCTSVKRFKSADYKGEDHTLVDVDLFSSGLDQPGVERDGKNLWDLSADAQTQLIRIFNERYPDNGQFTSVLNQEYLRSGGAYFTDFTRRDLGMVFTISKAKDYTALGEISSRFSPADRIETLRFSLEIPPEYNLQFTGWNRYATEYGEIEIADMSFSRSLDLNADLSMEIVDGGIKSSSGRKEDQALRSRYLKLNGSISPLRLEMEAEGTREIDLAGNVLADVSLLFDAFPEKIAMPLYSDSSGDAPLHLSQLRFVDVMVPRIKDVPESIIATLEMEYIYRHVESGWKSYPEWDDRVSYYSGRVTKTVTLFTRDEYLPLLYCLGIEEDGGSAVKIRTERAIDYPLRFMDYGEASRFLEWLSGRVLASGEPGPSLPVVVGTNTLLLGEQPLSAALISSMKDLKVIPVYQ